MDGLYLLLDVGGTEIKGGLMDSTGRILKDNLNYPAKAKERKETIFDNLAFILADMALQIPGADIWGIGMAFPGPFDYKNGISLMQGLDKYDSIYGISIEEEIKKRFERIKDRPLCFLHDVEAFAIGESYHLGVSSKEKLFCLCLGTGAGSAFIEGHKTIKEKQYGVPDKGWIYNTSFMESIIDDYLSVRGLARISKEIMGREQTGRELYELCCKGDEKAMSVYRLFGENLAEAVLPFLDSFQPDIMILGGQIVKSFSYFGNTLEKICRERRIRIVAEEDTSTRTMQGLYNCMRRNLYVES